MKALYYFGCVDPVWKGHHLWSDEQTKVRGLPDVPTRFVAVLDGGFVPLKTVPQRYRVSTVPPYRIVAWHDYTGDPRSGSNSALIGRIEDFDYGAEGMLATAVGPFPNVMARQGVLLPEDA